MTTTLASPPASPQIGPKAYRTVAELTAALGDIPGHRIRLIPAPGTATEQDVIIADAKENRLCELVDGVLVEKAMGFRESALAALLIELIGAFVRAKNLGLVVGPDGMLRLMPRLVRIPDVSFISWQRIPGGQMPTEKVPTLAPDLAVEVLSESNTPAEMSRKRDEYFAAGCRLVWQVDPDTRSVAVYKPGDPEPAKFAESDTLTGEDVLPGFTLPLRDLFCELDRSAPPTR